MNTKLKTACYLIAIFIAGAATGGVVGACAAKKMPFLRPSRPHEVTERLRFQYQTRLNLTPEQRKKIDPILDQTDLDLKAIHLQTMRQVAKTIDDAQQKIAAELTPEQKATLDSMTKERRDFLRRRGPGGFGGPGGPEGPRDRGGFPGRPARGGQDTPPPPPSGHP